MIKRLFAITSAIGLLLMVTAPVGAQSLHQTLPIASTAAGYQGTEQDCANLNLQPGQVQWHFVHTMTSSVYLPSTLTLTFQNAGTVTAPGFVNGSSVVMYNYQTPTADTLISASDTIGSAALPIGNLNLSHICQGGPPPVVPEAPLSALLLVTAGIAGLGFLSWRMRSASNPA